MSAEWPLKYKYRVHRTMEKNPYKNRTGNSNGKLKNRNKVGAKEKAKLVQPNHPVLLVKDGKQRFVRD